MGVEEGSRRVCEGGPQDTHTHTSLLSSAALGRHHYLHGTFCEKGVGESVSAWSDRREVSASRCASRMCASAVPMRVHVPAALCPTPASAEHYV